MLKEQSNTGAISHIVNKAVRAVEHKILRDFKELGFIQNSQKGTNDFALKTFDHIAKSIYKDLRQARPAYGFIINGQEIVDDKDNNGERFIIQPIDGFDNFAHSLPYFAISILVHHRNKPTQFFAFNPILNVEFELNQKGAFYNGQQVKASKRSSLSDALIASNEILPGTNIITSGCVALDLAYLASGKLDACIYKNTKLTDFPAVELLCTQIGGIAEDIGKNTVLISNGAIHNKLKELL